MAKRVARGLGGRFGRAGDPGVIIRYELNAEEYFAALRAMDAETDRWVNATAAKFDRIDRSAARMNTRLGGLSTTTRALQSNMSHLTRVVSKFGMAGETALLMFGGLLGSISYTVLRLATQFGVMGATLTLIGGLVVAIWRVQSLANWIEGVEKSNEQLEKMKIRLQESTLAAKKFHETIAGTLAQRKESARTAGLGELSPEGQISEQLRAIRMQLKADLAQPNLTDAERARFQDTYRRHRRTLLERSNALRGAGVDDSISPYTSMLATQELSEARKNRWADLNDRARMDNWTQNFERWQANEARAAALREARLRSRPLTLQDTLNMMIETMGANLAPLATRQRTMGNIGLLAARTGIPAHAISAMLGLGGIPISGSFQASAAQISSLNRAGGFGGTVQPKIEQYLAYLPKIETLLRQIQRTTPSGLMP